MIILGPRLMTKTKITMWFENAKLKIIKIPQEDIQLLVRNKNVLKTAYKLSCFCKLVNIYAMKHYFQLKLQV